MSFSNISETDMRYAQPYYYREPEFQLELNLQILRLALIMWMDALAECMVCSRAECCCEDSNSTISNSSSDSELEFSSSTESVVDEHHFIPAPDPNALPTPMWKFVVPLSCSPIIENTKDIENWVRASFPDFQFDSDVRFPVNENINNKVNTSWPPLPNSIWYNKPVYPSAEVPQTGQPLEPAVQKFFRNFSDVASSSSVS